MTKKKRNPEQVVTEDDFIVTRYADKSVPVSYSLYVCKYGHVFMRDRKDGLIYKITNDESED